HVVLERPRLFAVTVAARNARLAFGAARGFLDRLFHLGNGGDVLATAVAVGADGAIQRIACGRACLRVGEITGGLGRLDLAQRAIDVLRRILRQRQLERLAREGLARG